MRKYFIAIALILAMLLAGCTKANNQNIQITNTANEPKASVSPVTSTTPSLTEKTKFVVNELSSGEKGTFYLDMSRDDVIKILKSKNIDTSSEIEITSYKEAWDYGNKVLSAGGMRFAFDKNSKLYEITIESSTPTTLGLKLGDSVETMEKLYGKGYTISPKDVSSLYNYNMGNHFFTVLFDKGKVKTWEVQRADAYSIKEKQSNIKDNTTSQSNTNEWFAEDYKKVQTKYGTDFVGTKLLLNISADKKDNKIVITSTSESGKVAHIETKWDYTDAETGKFNFNDDDWGNKGEGSLKFQNDKIVVQIKLAKIPSSNWGIFNGEKTFTRNITPN